MVTASLDLAISQPSPALLGRTPNSNASTTICEEYESKPDARTAAIVREGLSKSQKQLPPWLFYDEAGSILFEQITELPEYYLTRIERGIFSSCAAEMIALAAGEQQLRLLELGAGSADKTRLLLAAACDFQGTVCYQPVDVSETALEAARERLEREHPEVTVDPHVADFTQELRLTPCVDGEKRLVMFIGSSIGNFLPEDALELLSNLHAALEPGDSLLLGVDIAPIGPVFDRESGDPESGGKSEADLVAAYDDAQGVTAEFNKNMLARLNRELGAEFDLESFQHRIRWNEEDSRIEMHLESLIAQRVRIPALDLEVDFAEGETIHTENSYKFRLGEVEEMLGAAGFVNQQRWRDDNGWFAVYLATRA
jgi:L-histidine N-alpha-methyltransferase